MIDTRIAEWKHLISSGKLDSLLIIGNDIPPAGLINGLSAIAKEIFVVCSKERHRKNHHNDELKHNVTFVSPVDDINKLPFAESSLQAIAIINAPYKIESLFKYCQKALSPKGQLIFLFKQKNFVRNLSTRLTTTYLEKKVQLHNFGHFRAYALVPSFDNARWIIPLRNGKITADSLSIYLPSLISARIKKAGAMLLSRIGLKQLWTPFRICFATKMSGAINKKHADLAYNLKKILKKDDIELSLFTGTPGYYQKTTVQIMDEKGSIIAYAKIAEHVQTKALLENEALILNDLKALDLKSGSVPEVLFYGNIGSKTLLIQSTVDKPSFYSAHKFTRAHIDFLNEIFRKTAKKQLLKNSHSLKELQMRIEQLMGKIPADWMNTLRKANEIVMNNLGDEIISCGLCHRDFTPWNILNNKGRLFIIDWEFARKDYIPFYDIFHFNIHKSLILKNKITSELQNPSALINRNLKKICRIYNNLIDNDFTLLNYFLLFYLCDSCSFYIYITIQYHPDKIRNKIIVNRMRMIEQFLKG
jgi:hypothetical protein